VLTVLDELGRHLVLLRHKPQVESSAISNFVVHIVQAPGQQYLHTTLDFGILLPNAKLGQRVDRSSTDDRVLQHHAVVDVPDVLRRLRRLRTFETEEIQDSNGELGELAVLDELAQVREGVLLRVGHELDEVEHALHHGTLELVATLVAEDTTEELQHAGLLAGELETERADGLHDGDLELVRDLGHEAGDLLHQPVHTGLVAGLEEGGNSESGDGAVAVGDQELDIRVAHADGLRLEGGEVVQDAEGSELGDGSWRGEEQL
jgi:hypothetical protein